MSINSSRPVSRYRSTQAELYAIAEIGWNSCLTFITLFAGLNTIYTAAYVAARLQEIADARNLPGFQQRDAVSEQAHTQLEAQLPIIINYWNRLESYIRKTLPKAERKTKIESAGSSYYASAVTGDWENVKLLTETGIQFATNNTAELTTAGMPANFIVNYTTQLTRFNLQYGNFISGEQSSKEGTDEKIDANNEMHETLMDMFSDGQVITYDNAATRDRFIFTKVKELVSSPGPAGLQGLTTNYATGGKLEAVTINIVELERSAFSSEVGEYGFTTLPAGTYTIIASRPSFTDTVIENYEVIKGTTSTLNIQLKAII